MIRKLVKRLKQRDYCLKIKDVGDVWCDNFKTACYIFDKVKGSCEIIETKTKKTLGIK